MTSILDEWSNREQKVMAALKLDRKTVDPKDNIDVQNHQRVSSFIEPVEQKLQQIYLINIKLIDLRKMASDRHAHAHTVILSIDEQRDMIKTCLTHIYPASFPYKAMVQNMLTKLEELDADFTNTKLKDFHK
jgi:hypothetical protein